MQPMRSFKMFSNMLALSVICLSLVSSSTESSYRPAFTRHRNWQTDASNEITTNPSPPDHTKLLPMARYVMHNADWASVATISTLPAIQGFPFTNIKSIVDGSLANSTGVPYFYMSPLDFTAKDLMANSRATILVTLEQTRFCRDQSYDPEDPRCTRLILSGKIKKIRENTTEYSFAKAALFERHPAMAKFPPDHNWFIAKLKIAQIAIIDWFGGANYIEVRDYLRYNYTGIEIINMYQQHTPQNTKAVYHY